MVRSRLKELQKRAFPKEASVGRGRRSTYDLTEILLIVTAFELADLHLSTPTAVEIVRSHRKGIVEAYLATWRRMGDLRDGITGPGIVAGRRQRSELHVRLAATTTAGSAKVDFGGFAADTHGLPQEVRRDSRSTCGRCWRTWTAS